MKALVYYGPEQYTLEERKKPEISDGDVLLKIVSAGICGTDLKIFKYGHQSIHPPVVTGHEIVGTVVESKSGKDVKVGTHMLVVTPVGCMTCMYCRHGKQNMCPEVSLNGHSIGFYTDGGFAEYMRVPKDAVEQGVLIPIPETDIPLTHFPICEPLSCVINGQEKLKISKEDVVVVMGAGPIGCMQVSLARAKGAKKIIIADIDEKKLALAHDMPADEFVLNTNGELKQVVMNATGGLGADVLIVAAPSGAGQEEAIALAAPLARISFFGGLPKTAPTITLNSNTVHYKELEIYGAYASSRAQYIEAMNLILEKKIDTSKLVTHTFPLTEIEKAIDVMKRGEAIKVVVLP